MKCIKQLNPEPKILRVPNSVAAFQVAAGLAIYVSKSIWKQNGREREK